MAFYSWLIHLFTCEGAMIGQRSSDWWLEINMYIYVLYLISIIYIYIYIYLYTYIYKCMYIYICTCVYIYIYLFIRIRIYLYFWRIYHTYLYIYIYIYYTYKYIYIYIFIFCNKSIVYHLKHPFLLYFGIARGWWLDQDLVMVILAWSRPPFSKVTGFARPGSKTAEIL